MDGSSLLSYDLALLSDDKKFASSDKDMFADESGSHPTAPTILPSDMKALLDGTKVSSPSKIFPPTDSRSFPSSIHLPLGGKTRDAAKKIYPGEKQSLTQ